MARLQGFERWLQEQKYFWYFLTWTQDGDQKRSGEAGVAVFCRVKPLAVEFGVGNKEADIVGRMISLLFHDFIMVVTYNPPRGVLWRHPYRQRQDGNLS